MSSSWKATDDGSTISRPDYSATSWYPIAQMPATVLETLQEAGVYPNLYFGMNMTDKVPKDLFRQDWWYRTSFEVPSKDKIAWLIFKGINYRAEVWLNGQRIAGNREIVGMYQSFQLNITAKVAFGETNVLAVKVTPEQTFQDIDGVELADTWHDWINWKYLGLHVADRRGLPFVPDRNAGIWKQVYLRTTGDVALDHPYVATDLSLPDTSRASLTVYSNLVNASSAPVSGLLRGEISREGKPSISFQQQLTLGAGERKEASFSPQAYPQLRLTNPDLWWPYTMGKPNLYRLHLSFILHDASSDVADLNFGVRKITQHRDNVNPFPQVGLGGNYYLKVNGVDFLVRGGAYTPDLLFKYDEGREEAMIRYVKDMGLNMMRWESKISSEHIIDLADREGVPLMFGWMCCGQWEKWAQWDEEDHRVAPASLRAQIDMLRAHPSVFVWANGSDGRPPDDVMNQYHSVLEAEHWQNGSVDTVSSYGKNAAREILWDGIHMEGPYSWRPPSYWFNGEYRAPRGSNAEQGDNEHIPPLESLKKFIPADKLWPINESWYYHAGANQGNSTLQTIQKVIEKRYGPSAGAEEFASKAQLAHYENTRAQFETFAASGWSDHKMTIYWMLNSQWPSFFGHIIDYYLKPGGAYYGAKKGLVPVNLVFDYYAPGDHARAKIYFTNQTMADVKNARATVALIDLDGTVKFSKTVDHLTAAPLSSSMIMEVPRVLGTTSTFFVRCTLQEASGHTLANNVYWQSTTGDDAGPPAKDRAFTLDQTTWADFSALRGMNKANVATTAALSQQGEWTDATVTLANRSAAPAFFLRVELSDAPDGNELLPVTWDDNYVTVFGGESLTLHARYVTKDISGKKLFARIEGQNVGKFAIPMHE